MSLQFIIGGSGSGKTRRAIETCIHASLLREHPACFLLIPEQNSLQTQAQVVALHERGGTMDLDIVSFSRLAMRVFEELQIPKPVLLDDTAKSLLLRRVAAEKEAELTLFRKNIGRPGFIDKLKSMISELYQYRIDEETLERLQRRAEKKPLLQAKLQDLLVVSQAFREALEENTIPEEAFLDVLC